MASAFSHAVAALAIGKLFSIRNIDKKIWLLGVFCAVIPDADVIAFKFGIPYESVWGHRGITHSLFFAVFLALAGTLFFYREEQRLSKRWFALFAFFFLCTASHAFLDAMTTGGLGVAFFAPFDNTRFFFPFRPIRVSPIGVANFFSEWGWRVLKSEFIWIWIPSFIIIMVSYSVRKLYSR
ncbi:MAG: metal-dependent hydrolase [Bacteroidota bacterium]